MSSVDERIVKMVFDNGNFEKNAATTMGTLDRLKASLDFSKASDSLNRIQSNANSINFGQLASSIDQISGRFTNMGIAGATVIADLTRSVLDLGKNIAGSVISPIATGGWARASNIAAAKFQIEGLGKSWEVLSDDINYGVKDTAYGLDAAAKVAAQLSASNIEAGDSMKMALRGISGVAAMTNSSYEDIGSIFTTIASNGKLMTQQLRQFSFRGLNVAATLADALNTTEAEVNEMVTKGKIDFAQFSKAMDDAFGKHAKEANKTYTGALANMKAALSRIGANFATPFQENMRDVYNAIRPLIDTLNKEKFTQIYADFEDFAAKASDFITNILGRIDLSFVDKLVDKIHKAYLMFDQMMSAVAPGWGKERKKIILETAEATEELTEAEKDYEEVVKRVRAGEYGNGEERRKRLEEDGYVYEVVQNKVNELEGSTFRYAVSAEDAAKATKELSTETKGHGKSLERLVNQLEEADSSYNPRLIYRELLGGDDKSANNLLDTINGAVSAFNLLKSTVESVISGASEPFNRIVDATSDSVLDVTGAIGRWITSIYESMEANGSFESIQTSVNEVMSSVADIFEIIRGIIDDLTSEGGGLDTILKGIFNPETAGEIGKFSDSLKGPLDVVNDLIGAFRDYLTSDGTQTFGDLKDRLAELCPVIAALIPLVFTILKDITIFNTARTINSISTAVNQLPGIFRGIKRELNSDALLKVAESLGILAASFFLLSQLSWEQIGKGVITIAALAGVLTFLFFVVSKLNKGKGRNEIYEAINGIVKAFSAKMNADAIFTVSKAFGILAASMFLLSQLSWEQIGKGAASIVVLALALDFLMRSISHNGSGFKDEGPLLFVKKTISGLTASFKNMLGAIGTSAIIGSMAFAIFAIGKIVTDLSSISWTNGVKAIVLLEALLLEFVFAIGLLDKVAGKKGNIQLAFLIFSLSETIKSIGQTVESLSGISWGDGLKSLAFIGLMFLELSLMIKSLSKMEGNGVSDKTLAIMAVLTFLVKSIGNTMTKLSSIPLADGVKALGYIAVMFFMLVTVMKSIDRVISWQNGFNKKTVIIMAALTLMVSSLSKTLVRLSDIPLASGIKSLLMLGGLFAILYIVMKKANDLESGKGSFKMVGTVLAFSIAVMILTESVKALSKIGGGDLAKAILAIGGISLIMMGLMTASKHINGDITGTLKAILPMVITLGAFVAAIWVLSTIEPERLVASVEALIRVIGALSLFSMSTRGFGHGDMGTAIANYLGMASILTTIALIFDLLRDMDPENMLSIADSMSEVMVALSVLSVAAGQLGKNGGGVGFVDTFTSTLGSGIANTLNTDIMLANILGIELIAAAVNTAFPGFKEFLDNGAPLLQTIGETIGSLFGGFLKKAVFEPLFGSLGEGGQKALDFINELVEFTNASEDVKEGSVDKLERIKELMEAVGNTSWSGVIANVKSAFFDTGGLEASLTEITAFLTSFSTFSENLSGIDSNQDSNIEKFEAIKTLMGSVGDTAWSGTIAAIKTIFFSDNSLNDAMDELSKFLTKFSEFRGNLDNVSVSAKDKVKVTNVRGVIDALGDTAWSTTVANLKSTFYANTYLFASMDGAVSFLDKFKTLKEKIDDYSPEGDTTSGKIKTVNGILEDLGTLSVESFVTNFKSAVFSRWGDLSEALERLKVFIGHLNEIQAPLSDISYTTSSKIQLIQRIMESLKEISWQSLITSILDNIGPKRTVEDFSGRLLQFANAMVAYSAVAKSIDEGAVTASQNVANMLLALNAEIPDSGGLLNLIAGEGNLGTFGTQIANFAGGMATFHEKIGKKDFSNVTNATDAVKSLLGAFNEIAGNQQGDMNNVEYASQIAQNMANVVTSLFTNIDYFLDEDSNFDEVKNFGETLFKKVLEGFTSASENIGSGADTESAKSIASKIVEALTSDSVSDETIKTAGEAFISKFTGSWVEALGSEENARILDGPVGTILGNVVTKAQEYRDKFDTEASDALLEVHDIIELDTSLASAVGAICQAMVDTARSYVGQFTSIGGDMMSGLALGISINQHLAVNAASNAAAAANAASKEVVGAHSPAREFIWLGEMCMRGLAIGFDQNSYRSEHAASRAANVMVGTMNRMLSEVGEEAEAKSLEIFQNLRNLYNYINAVITESLDVDPTIRPVLDLSNIQNGVTGINSMLSGPGYAFGIDGIRYAQAMYPGSYQYGAEKSTMSTQAGIISAIRGVRSDINYLGERIANMQMVMDSGAIVGSIGGGMDRQLGNIQKYKERWA